MGKTERGSMDCIFPQSLQALCFVSRWHHCLQIGGYFQWGNPDLLPSHKCPLVTTHTTFPCPREFPQGLRVDKGGISCCQKDKIEF